MDKNIQKKINQLIDEINNIKELKKFLDDFLKHDFRQKKYQITPRIYIVGGAVRDALLGNKTKDYDFVIEGLTKKQIVDYLDSTKGTSLDIASRNFGVFKYKPPKSKLVIDVALPRQDVYLEHGKGHKDVQTQIKNDFTIQDDLSRRDFTINAMAVDFGDKKLIDYFDGVGDIKRELIRCVGDPFERLVLEDPTRIMRALRFSTQLGFNIAPRTLKVIKKYHPEINKKFEHIYQTKKGIKKTKMAERVSREIIALEFVRGFDHDPVKYIRMLDEYKIYKTLLLPDEVEIWEKMKTTDQPKNLHAEGSVWNHSMVALGNIALLKKNKLGLRRDASINLKLAVFFHDIGKVTTIEIDETGKFTFYNHPDESVRISNKIINHLKLFSASAKDDRLRVDSKQIAYLIKHHMLPTASYSHEMKDKTIVKYFIENEDLGQELLQLAYIDASSSIKAVGPQDYTGIKRTLKKIEIAQDKLSQINNEKKIYPVDGNKIKNILGQVVIEYKSGLEPTKYEELCSIINSSRGGRLIGEIKEIILEEALAAPELFNTTRQKNIQLKKIISKIIEKEYI